MAQDVCSRCGYPISAGARFCRECGAPVAGAVSPAAPASEPSEVCPSCGAPNAPGARFCRQCGHALTGGAENVAAAAGEAAVSRAPATGAQPPISSRWKTLAPARFTPSRTVAIGIAAVLLAASAIGAYALTRGEDGGGAPQQSAQERAEQDAPAVQEDPTGPTAPEVTTSDVPSAPTATTPGAAAEGDENPDTPTGVMRAHWKAIDKADYAAAYRLFSSRYRATTSERRWTSEEAAYAPKVRINAVTYLTELAGNQAFVLVDILTRDTGPKGDGSKCNRFSGKVRVIKENGSWRYWATGPQATWGKRPGLPRSDPRCRPLFS